MGDEMWGGRGDGAPNDRHSLYDINNNGHSGLLTRVVLEPLAHLLAVFCQHQAVHDQVLEGGLVEQGCGSKEEFRMAAQSAEDKVS